MGFSEFEIEQFIWDNIQNQGELSNRGLNLHHGIFYRQLDFPSCGRPDLVCVSANSKRTESWLTDRKPYRHSSLIISIYELKKGRADADAVVQLSKYMGYVEQNQELILEHFNISKEKSVYVNAYLVANSITKDAASLINNIHNAAYIGFKFDIMNGIRFDHPEQFPLQSPIYQPFKRGDFSAVKDSHLIESSPILSRALRMKQKPFSIENPN